MATCVLQYGPPLSLDSLILLQLAKDEEFYAALPPAAEDFVRDAGHGAARLWTSRRKPLPLGKCVATFRSQLGQSLSWFVRNDAAALEGLIAMIASKRNYRPRPIVLHYADEHERPAVVTF